MTLCLSKGLGCPLGALLATSAELAPKARRLKHLFGGAMRQAGVVAATGLYALDHHVERLAEDHANARKLADGARGGRASGRPRPGRDELRPPGRKAAGTYAGRRCWGASGRRGFSSPSPSERTCSAPSPTWTSPPRTSSARSRAPAELFPGSAARLSSRRTRRLPSDVHAGCAGVSRPRPSASRPPSAEKAAAPERQRRRRPERRGSLERGRRRRGRRRRRRGDSRHAVPRRVDHEDLHRRRDHAAPGCR